MGNQLAAHLETHSTSRKWGLQNQGLTKRDVKIVAQHLKNNAYVEELDISNNNIGDEGAVYLAKALAKNTKLSVLHLHHCNIADAGVDAIAKSLKDNNTLKEINLSNNRISDNGVACLSETIAASKVLEKIIMKFNFCGDSAAESLASGLRTNRSLRHLDLEHNQLGSVAAWAFADALLVNNTLGELYLSYNQVGDPGARALSEMLLRNTTLETLLLSGNQFSYQIKQEISENIIARRTAKHEINELELRIAEQHHSEQEAAKRDVNLLQAEAKASISKKLGIPTMTPLMPEDEDFENDKQIVPADAVVRYEEKETDKKKLFRKSVFGEAMMGESPQPARHVRIRELREDESDSPSTDSRQQSPPLYTGLPQIPLDQNGIPRVSVLVVDMNEKEDIQTPGGGSDMLARLARKFDRAAGGHALSGSSHEYESLLRQYQEEVAGARRQWLEAEKKEMHLERQKAEVEGKNDAIVFMLKEKEKMQAQLLAKIEALESQLGSSGLSGPSDKSHRLKSDRHRDKELAEVKQQLKMQEGTMRELRQQNRQLQSQLADKAIEESRLRERIDTLELSLEDISSISEMNQQAASRINSGGPPPGDIDPDVDTELAQYNPPESGSAAAHIAMLEEQLENAQAHAARLQRLLDSVHAHKAQLLEESTTRSISLQQQLESANTQIDTLESEVDSLKSENVHLRQQNEELISRSTEGTNSSNPDEARLRAKLLKEKAELQQTVNELRLAHAVLQDMYDQQQQLLIQLNPDMISGDDVIDAEQPSVEMLQNALDRLDDTSFISNDVVETPVTHLVPNLNC